jgi:serine/threonine protein kinase
LCRAEADLHAKGIVHGDQASQNILIDANTYQVKVVDFDLSTEKGTKMQAGDNIDFAHPEMLVDSHQSGIQATITCLKVAWKKHIS